MFTRYLSLLIILLLSACQAEPPEVLVDAFLVIPEKAADSVSLQDSLINPSNLDDYLFRSEVSYVDLRNPNQFIEEGHIAGFINIPFYGLLIATNSDEFGLFNITRVTNEQGQVIAAYGTPGSFVPRYEESVSILRSLFSRRKVIFAISTAGVESQYLLNLLLQYEYDGTQLYNVGNFSNSLGSLIAYRLRKDVSYLVEGQIPYIDQIIYDFGPLTPIKE